MSRFVVGQRVRCIKPNNPRPNPEGTGGGGWAPKREFIIERISNNSYLQIPILWSDDECSGVYEDYVENTNGWDNEEN